jgi:hypothetical protein
MVENNRVSCGPTEKLKRLRAQTRKGTVDNYPTLLSESKFPCLRITAEIPSP